MWSFYARSITLASSADELRGLLEQLAALAESQPYTALCKGLVIQFAQELRAEAPDVWTPRVASAFGGMLKAMAAAFTWPGEEPAITKEWASVLEHVVNFESSSEIICDALEDLAFVVDEHPEAVRHPFFKQMMIDTLVPLKRACGADVWDEQVADCYREVLIMLVRNETTGNPSAHGASGAAAARAAAPEQGARQQQQPQPQQQQQYQSNQQQQRQQHQVQLKQHQKGQQKERQQQWAQQQQQQRHQQQLQQQQQRQKHPQQNPHQNVAFAQQPSAPHYGNWGGQAFAGPASSVAATSSQSSRSLHQLQYARASAPMYGRPLVPEPDDGFAPLVPEPGNGTGGEASAGAPVGAAKAPERPPPTNPAARGRSGASPSAAASPAVEAVPQDSLQPMRVHLQKQKEQRREQEEAEARRRRRQQQPEQQQQCAGEGEGQRDAVLGAPVMVTSEAMPGPGSGDAVPPHAHAQHTDAGSGGDAAESGSAADAHEEEVDQVAPDVDVSGQPGRQQSPPAKPAQRRQRSRPSQKQSATDEVGGGSAGDHDDADSALLEAEREYRESQLFFAQQDQLLNRIQLVLAGNTPEQRALKAKRKKERDARRVARTEQRAARAEEHAQRAAERRLRSALRRTAGAGGHGGSDGAESPGGDVGYESYETAPGD